jgi:two-component system cell cycle response regulator
MKVMQGKGKQLHLLIVEDDEDQRDLIRETLEEHFGRGTVVSAGSRQEALAKDLGEFDLILSDYNLPDGSGMDLLEDVKTRCSTPVILVTGENVGETAVSAIRRGAVDYVVKFGDYLFTIPLVVEKNLTVAEIKRQNELLQEELRKKNKLLEEMASTDGLTGLFNRRYFNTVLEQLFAEAERYGTDLACVMIDMDGFKQLNDTCGHQVGDQLLQLVGRVIRGNLRRADVAARYGGDEFVLLLPQQSGEEVLPAIDRIRTDFKQALANTLPQAAKVSMSIGLVSKTALNVAGGEQLLAAADAAMYRAKQSGRDRVSRDPNMNPPLKPAA